MTSESEQEARRVASQLADLRQRLAEYEAARHDAKVLAFMQSTAKTVKEMEYHADYATLNLNRDILMVRAEIRTLEDRLEIEIAFRR